MAAPNETELKLLEKFREKVRDINLNEYERTDMFLLSWIRARENDLIKAEDMMRKSMEWRKKEDIENIFTWQPPSHYNKAYHWYLTGADNDGRPAFCLPLGIWDVRAAVSAGERSIYVRYVDQVFAEFVKAIRETKNEREEVHTQFVIILDMKGLTLKQFTSPSTQATILETFRRFEANYPETLKTAFVINAPRIFPIAFEIVKPLLSQRTRKKIQIYNSNMEKWKHALLEVMPEKSLPVEYQNCSKILNTDSSIDDGLLVERCVDAGGKLEIHYHVKDSDSILRWEFETINYDIGFAIFHETKEVISYERWDSHVKKAEGSIVCKNPGKYTLAFDNSYSRIRSKVIRYMVTVLENNEEDSK